jgi:hypothetical protein
MADDLKNCEAMELLENGESKRAIKILKKLTKEQYAHGYSEP